MKESKGKKAFKKPFLILGLAFIALGCTLGLSSLAWFATPSTSASVTKMEGEANGSYFESGTGVEGDPYIIANAKQLYYFAWLQDMGFFNSPTTDESTAETTIQTTYFKIKDGLTSIDASGYVLPPVGIEKYPFVGNFDANNCTITGLTVSNKIGTGYIEEYPTLLDTENSKLTKEEFNGEDQASIVGFFGIIGEYNKIPSATYDSETNEVKNLYLDDLTIKTSDKSNLLIGIFAGYVNGLIDNCGVHYAKMNINGATSKLSNFSNVSRFTLIGDYNTDEYRYAQDTESGSSGDEGYGTSIDVYSLYNKLSTSLGSTDNPLTVPSNYAIPIKFDSSKSVVAGSGTTTVTSSGSSISATNASTIPVDSSSKNIGYYSGSLQVFKDKFGSIDFTNISEAGNASSVKYSTLTDEEKNKIQTYLATSTSTGRSGDNALYLNGTSYFDGTTYTRAQPFPTSTDAYSVIQNAKVGDWNGNLFIPNNGIWVAPINAGRFEFICTGNSSWGSVILIIRLQRSTAQDYSTGFKNINFSVDFYGAWTNNAVGFFVKSSEVAYYGLNISNDDIEAGYEYFITSDAGSMNLRGCPYIFYLDIGTDAGSGGDTDTKTVITNFDFVTKDSDGSLTKIKNYNETSKTYEANEDYELSEVTFKIGDTTDDTTLAFRRLNDTVGVYYYQSSAILTPSANGTKTSTTKEDCTSA